MDRPCAALPVTGGCIRNRLRKKEERGRERQRRGSRAESERKKRERYTLWSREANATRRRRCHQINRDPPCNPSMHTRAHACASTADGLSDKHARPPALVDEGLSALTLHVALRARMIHLVASLCVCMWLGGGTRGRVHVCVCVRACICVNHAFVISELNARPTRPPPPPAHSRTHVAHARIHAPALTTSAPRTPPTHSHHS